MNMVQLQNCFLKLIKIDINMLHLKFLKILILGFDESLIKLKKFKLKSFLACTKKACCDFEQTKTF